MQPRRALVRVATVAAASGSLLLTACSGGPVGRAPAATVNGAEISVDDVFEAIEATAEVTRVDAPSPDDAESALEQLRGAGASTYASDAAAQQLGQLVLLEIVRQELADAGRPVTDEDREAARTAYEQQITSQGGSIAEYPAEYIDLQVEFQAATTAIREVVVEEYEPPTAEEIEADVQAAYEAYRTTNTHCVSLIYTADQAAGEAARTRVERGEAFGAVAAVVSTDPSAAGGDGDAGCFAPDQISQFSGTEFAALQEGDLVGPVEVAVDQAGTTQWVLIRLDSTESKPLPEVRAELEAQVASQGDPATDQQLAGQLLQEWVAEAVDRADVHVSTRFGTWDAENGTVVARSTPATEPADPAATEPTP